MKKLIFTAAACLLSLNAMAGWDYSQDEDPMSGARTLRAAVHSENLIELGWPYGGPQRGTLVVRDHARFGKHIIVKVARGQMTCPGYDNCYVTVRFDEGKPVKFSYGEPADGSSTALFVLSYGRFVKRMVKAKRVRIAVQFFQNGNQIFDFDVSGFEQDKYRPK